MGENDLHVTPIDDLRPHEDASTCWCKPKENEPGVWTHNALDGRESYENGRKLQ